LSTVSAGGWGWKLPSAARTPTMIAPPRTSAIGWPSPAQPDATSISSMRYSGATSTTPETCGFRASRAISAPLVL
jgi:hypothetical protein